MHHNYKTPGKHRGAQITSITYKIERDKIWARQDLEWEESGEDMGNQGQDWETLNHAWQQRC